ncbi:autotransporter outer membrane beta-barrel domain-containing protein [Cardiobacteriaceae bacterium TAE3-ERU3]|nr:autotransporter outer membrane beta-barrel domain-containing protein [Cardiobacteriaceae bacterium TAE3-ERU3]
MNHIYKTVWNEALGSWVAVSELSKSHSTRSSSIKVFSVVSLAAIAAVLSPSAHAGIECTPTSTNGVETYSCISSASASSGFSKTLGAPSVVFNLDDSSIDIDTSGFILHPDLSSNDIQDRSLTLNLNRFKRIKTTKNGYGTVWAEVRNSRPNSESIINIITDDTATIEGGSQSGSFVAPIYASINLDGNAKIIFDSPNVTITGPSKEAVGLFADQQRGSGDTSIEIRNGTVTFSDVSSTSGAFSLLRGAGKEGNARVLMSGGKILLHNANTSIPLFAMNNGVGDASINIKEGNITIERDNSSIESIKSSGALALLTGTQTNVNQQAITNMSGGSISINADQSYGIAAAFGDETGNIGNVKPTAKGTAIINLNEPEATASALSITIIGNKNSGAYASHLGENGKASINMAAGSVKVISSNPNPDDYSNGLFAEAGGMASIIQTGGSVVAEGSNSHALTAISTHGDVNVEIAGTLSAHDRAINTLTQVDANRNDTGMSRVLINDGAKITAKTAVYNDGGHSDTIIGRAKIASSVQETMFDLNDGNDNLTFKDTDLSNIGKINGGINTDVNDEFDILTFADYSAAPTFSGDNLKNWERINLNSDFNLSGRELEVGKGGVASNAGGLFIGSGATLSIDADDKSSFTINGDLHNDQADGVLNLRRDGKDEFTELTIDGDYHGGGTVLFNTRLGDYSSPTDKLVLKGNVDGITKVKVANKGGVGDLTNKGIELVSTANATSGNNISDDAFILDGSVQAGSYEYNTLAHLKGEGFYLQSRRKSSGGKGSDTSAPVDIKKPDPKPTPKPDHKPNLKPDPKPYVPEVYRPAVPGYVMAQYANIAATSSMLGNHLHQRMGEQQINKLDEHNYQAWGRIRAESLSLEGKKQFNLDQDTQLIQFGWDLGINRDDQNNRSHTGIYLGYANSDADFFDRKRAEVDTPILTGNVDTNILSAGAYYTHFDEQGSYIDLIGGVHYLDNQYKDIYSGKSKNKGWGIAASAEAGWHKDLGDGYFVEPQAQLTAQVTKYGAFNDEISSIDGYGSNSLRPRLGVRAGLIDKASGKDLYMTASVVHELLSPATVTIGGTDIREEIGKDTWLEAGVGGQVSLSDNTTLYGSAQYYHTLGGKSRRGGSGQIGLRYSW